MGTAVAGAGEGVTLGFDTPVTVTFGAMTDVFGSISLATKAGASVANAYASGNTQPLKSFDWSGLANIAAAAAASKINALHRWAESIGNMAEQGVDLAAKSEEGCP